MLGTVYILKELEAVGMTGGVGKGDAGQCDVRLVIMAMQNSIVFYRG